MVLAAIAVSVVVAGIVVLGLVNVTPQPEIVEKVIPSGRLSR